MLLRGKGKPIEKQPAPFNPGDRVRFRCQEEDPQGIYTVEACTHTHTQLEGFKFATVNWRLQRIRKAQKSEST